MTYAADGYVFDLETEQDSVDVFDQVIAYSGQASEMPAYVWRRPDPQFSMPIPAWGQRPLQANDLNAYWAAWVPHSGPVDALQPAVPHHANNDIGYSNLAAPSFSVSIQ